MVLFCVILFDPKKVRFRFPFSPASIQFILCSALVLILYPRHILFSMDKRAKSSNPLSIHCVIDSKNLREWTFHVNKSNRFGTCHSEHTYFSCRSTQCHQKKTRDSEIVEEENGDAHTHTHTDTHTSSS